MHTYIGMMDAPGSMAVFLLLYNNVVFLKKKISIPWSLLWSQTFYPSHHWKTALQVLSLHHHSIEQCFAIRTDRVDKQSLYPIILPDSGQDKHIQEVTYSKHRHNARVFQLCLLIPSLTFSGWPEQPRTKISLTTYGGPSGTYTINLSGTATTKCVCVGGGVKCMVSYHT